MKNYGFLLLVLAVATLLTNSCRDLRDPELPDTVNTNHIRFDQMAVGQVSKYLGLVGEHFYDGNGSEFTYSDDTLVLEIIGHDASGFKVAETLHYVDSVSNWYAGEKDSTYYYYLKVVGDSLQIDPVGSPYLASRLFASTYPSNTLPLVDIASPEVAITGWKTGFPYCECRNDGFTQNYLLFGQTYPRLNVIVDNSFMAVDGPGHTYVYSAQEGVVKFSQYSWWTSTGYGWDLLPD